MTTKFKFEHDFPTISLDKFEAYLNNEKLNDLLEKNLGFDERRMIKKDQGAGGKISWQFRVKKNGDIPGVLQKLIDSDGFAWIENSTFVPDEHCIYFEIVPEAKSLKFRGEGVWQLKSAGKGCKRVIEGQIKVDVPFIGKVAESFIINELKKTYDVEPSLQEKFYSSL